MTRFERWRRATSGFAGRSALVSSVKAVQAAAALAATLVLAGVLGPDGLGAFERAMSLPLMFAPLARMAGAHAGLAMRSRGHPLPAIFGSVIAVSSAGAAVAVLAVSVVAFNVVELAVGSILALLVVTSLYSAKEVLKALSWMRGDAATDNVVAAAISVLRLAAFTVAWLVGYLTVERVLWLIAAIWLLSVAVYARQEVARHAPVQIRWQGGAVGACFRVAIPVSANLLALGLLLRIDILLLDVFAVPTGDIGRYGIAVRLAEALWLVPLAIAQVFVVDASRASPGQLGSGPDLASLVRRTLGAVIAGAIVVLALLVIVVRVWADAYRGSELLLLLLIPGIAAYSVVPTLRNHVILHGSLVTMTALAGAAVAVNVVLNLVLIPAWGVEGAPVATSVAYLVLFVGMLRLGSRATGHDPLPV